MSDFDWHGLPSRLEVPDRLRPVDADALDAAANKLGVALPASYRSFCRVLGAGTFGLGDFKIAAPGYKGDNWIYSLVDLTNSQRELASQFEELGLDGEQIARGVFFAIDMSGTNHFFDPEDVTNDEAPEYAVYSLFRNYEIERTFDNFSTFVTSGCLGDKRNYLLALEDEEGESPSQAFKPM